MNDTITVNISMIFVMKPKKGLDKENDAAEKQKLADYKASLTENELEQVVSDTKELKLYQERYSVFSDTTVCLECREPKAVRLSGNSHRFRCCS